MHISKNFCKIALPFREGYFNAQMAELVDALVSGTSVRKYVQVRVLFWARNESEVKVKFFKLLNIVR